MAQVEASGTAPNVELDDEVVIVVVRTRAAIVQRNQSRIITVCRQGRRRAWKNSRRNSASLNSLFPVNGLNLLDPSVSAFHYSLTVKERRLTVPVHAIAARQPPSRQGRLFVNVPPSPQTG